MLDVQLNIALHKNQQRIHESPALYKVIKAGKRFGKTKFAIYALLRMAGLNKGVYWYIAPTYKQAKSIAWREIISLLPKQFIRRQLENDLYIELVNGSIIELKGADNEDSLRGIHLDGVVLDEAAYIKKYLWNNILWGQLLGSNGRSGFAWFISSPVNPRKKPDDFEDWFPEFYMEAMRKNKVGEKDWEAWHYTIYDNPTLSKQQIDVIKDNSLEDEWNVEYMALEVPGVGPLVPEFKFDFHVKEVDTKANDWKLVRGLDWGIDHPTVCLWAHVNVSLRLVYISDEFVKSGLLIQDSCGAIKKITAGRDVEWSVIDPSTSRRNSQTNLRDLDEFIRCGVAVIPGDNNNRGYDIMRKFFKRNLIVIDPKCRHLINELRTVQVHQKEGEDCLDSLRYTLVRVHDLMFQGILEGPEQVKARPKYSLLDTNMFPKNPHSRQSKVREEAEVY